MGLAEAYSGGPVPRCVCVLFGSIASEYSYEQNTFKCIQARALLLLLQITFLDENIASEYRPPQREQKCGTFKILHIQCKPKSFYIITFL